MISSLFLPLKTINSLFCSFFYDCGISTLSSCVVQLRVRHLLRFPHRSRWIRGRSHCSSLVRNKWDPGCQSHNCITFSCSSSQRHSARARAHASHLNANLPFKNPPLARLRGAMGVGARGVGGPGVKLLEAHRCKERQAWPPLLNVV